MSKISGRKKQAPAAVPECFLLCSSSSSSVDDDTLISNFFLYSCLTFRQPAAPVLCDVNDICCRQTHHHHQHVTIRVCKRRSADPHFTPNHTLDPVRSQYNIQCAGYRFYVLYFIVRKLTRCSGFNAVYLGCQTIKHIFFKVSSYDKQNACFKYLISSPVFGFFYKAILETLVKRQIEFCHTVISSH